LLAVKDAKRGEESKLLALHEVIAEALEVIESQGHNVDMLNGNNDCEAEQFFTMAALYILDKLSEVTDSTRLEDKMKVMFSRAQDSDEYFIELLRELLSAIRVSITKDRRLIAELKALGQRADVLKSLEYMREMVARESARLGILEQLLAGAHVGMRLKAEYAADMGETSGSVDCFICLHLCIIIRATLMKRQNMTVLVLFISSLLDDNVKVDFAALWEFNMKKPDTGLYSN
ncbi:hypothetical protein Tco_0732790, partial [Tanacetum coccineum]